MRRTISQQTSIYHLPTADELEKDGDRVVPPSEFRLNFVRLCPVCLRNLGRQNQHPFIHQLVEQAGHNATSLTNKEYCAAHLASLVQAAVNEHVKVEPWRESSQHP
mmetsp:Transcript_10817/g.14329  ORF Transcript_10817/g.14329 Transcript_10817/m.14329 type:complete len:106 (-) Transcript_10817:56-373(-)